MREYTRYSPARFNPAPGRTKYTTDPAGAGYREPAKRRITRLLNDHNEKD